jgi:LPXTG-motif cell wall-anchored protein
LLVAVSALALPSAAVASPPAQGQYTTPNPNATGGQGPNGPGSVQVPPGNASGGGSGDAALPILLAGVAVIGGAGGYLLYRRRRTNPHSPE